MDKDLLAICLSIVLVVLFGSFASSSEAQESRVNFSPPEIALGYKLNAQAPALKREKSVSRSQIRISPIEKPNKKRFVKAKSKRYSGEVSPTGRNQRIGKELAAARGWDGRQWNCLRDLWIKESGWSTRSSNSSGTAWGIPQALPGSKMAKFGSDWRTNPVTQIKWGLHYIDNRYGTPCKAWGHFQSHNWY